MEFMHIQLMITILVYGIYAYTVNDNYISVWNFSEYFTL